MMSEICATSSSAAIARRDILAEARRRQTGCANTARPAPTTSAATILRGLARQGAAHRRAAPWRRRQLCAAAFGRARGVVPGDQHVNVAADLLRGGDRMTCVQRRACLQRYAMVVSRRRRVIAYGDASRNHLRFVAQLGDQLLDVGHLAAALALRRLDDLERRQPRRDVDAERLRLRRSPAASSSPS